MPKSKRTTKKSPDFWKDQYEGTWKDSSDREKAIKRNIERYTGAVLQANGLGAESTEYIKGSARKNGKKKGEADFVVVGTNIHVEVTGDLTGKITQDKPLWIRPDKIREAIRNRIIDKWIVHHLVSDNTLRVIQINDEFKTRFDNGDFKIITPWIRGHKETYVEVKADDRSVCSFLRLVHHINQRKNHGEVSQ